MRIAFALEGVANMFSAVPMIYNPGYVYSIISPDKTLDVLKSHPAAIMDNPDLAASLIIQWIGALIVGLTIPLALGALDNPHFAVTRKMTYYTLGAGEAFIIPMMFWQLFSGATQGAMITDGFLKAGILNLSGILAWRIFALTHKPHWFGDIGLVNSGSSRAKSS